VSDGDLSALFTLLAVSAGGLIAGMILWLFLREPKSKKGGPHD
jgi:hypothetical protein